MDFRLKNAENDHGSKFLFLHQSPSLKTLRLLRFQYFHKISRINIELNLAINFIVQFLLMAAKFKIFFRENESLAAKFSSEFRNLYIGLVK